MTKNIMFQGTGSDVGKSFLVAGICRALKRRGMNPVPFKPQNMSNNAGVTADGGEIGSPNVTGKSLWCASDHGYEFCVVKASI